MSEAGPLGSPSRVVSTMVAASMTAPSALIQDSLSWLERNQIKVG